VQLHDLHDRDLKYWLHHHEAGIIRRGVKRRLIKPQTRLSGVQGYPEGPKD
jgi:hypothetical protein